MTYKGAPMMSKDQTWATPWSVVSYLEDAFGIVFDLDAAAASGTAKANHYFTKEDDALKQKWFGDVWLNPPFGLGGKLQRQFIEKAIMECCILKNASSVTCLIPARTDTKLFHDLIVPNAHGIYFVNGRINFIKTGKKTPGANATFPSMVVRFVAKTPSHPRREALWDTIDMPQAIRRGKV